MIRRKTSELLIRPRMSDRQRLVMVLLSIIIIVTLLTVTYKLGVDSVEANFINNEVRIDELEIEVSELNKLNGKLHADLALAERQRQIQEQAYKEVSDAYAGVVEKNEFLNRRLDFYRSIISPENGKAGVKIYNFESRPNEDKTKLIFDLTLVQSIRHNTNVRANVRVAVYQAGDRNKPVAVWPRKDGKAVSFKYYEKISGELIAQELGQEEISELEFKVDVKIRGEKGSDITKWYSLPSVEENKINVGEI